MSGTSSDSDVEYGPGFTVRNLNQARWTPKLEACLEEMLVRNQFDFKSTSREFERHLNREEDDKSIVYKIEPKTLQLRWTDIEIRRHHIPKMD